MSGFYVSMIFIGSLLILFSLLCVFLDKRKVFSLTKNYEEKKQELVEIINDAEQMIEEMNKFSDYVVNQMDLKNEELNKNLKDVEEKICLLGEKAKSAAVGIAEAVNEPVAIRASATVNDTVAMRTSAIVNDKATVIRTSAAVNETAAMRVSAEVNEAVRSRGASVIEEKHTLIAEPIEEIVEIAVNSGVSDKTPHMKIPVKKNEKVIPINNKYSEVIRLSEEGMVGSEIAKTLNIGKGEVELILGMRK